MKIALLENQEVVFKNYYSFKKKQVKEDKEIFNKLKKYLKITTNKTIEVDLFNEQ